MLYRRQGRSTENTTQVPTRTRTSISTPRTSASAPIAASVAAVAAQEMQGKYQLANRRESRRENQRRAWCTIAPACKFASTVYSRGNRGQRTQSALAWIESSNAQLKLVRTSDTLWNMISDTTPAALASLLLLYYRIFYYMLAYYVHDRQFLLLYVCNNLNSLAPENNFLFLLFIFYTLLSYFYTRLRILIFSRPISLVLLLIFLLLLLALYYLSYFSSSCYFIHSSSTFIFLLYFRLFAWFFLQACETFFFYTLPLLTLFFCYWRCTNFFFLFTEYFRCELHSIVSSIHWGKIEFFPIRLSIYFISRILFILNFVIIFRDSMKVLIEVSLRMGFHSIVYFVLVFIFNFFLFSKSFQSTKCI